MSKAKGTTFIILACLFACFSVVFGFLTLLKYEEVNKMETRNDRLNLSIADYESEIETLESEIEELETESKNIDNETINTLNAEIETLNSEITTLNDEIAGLETKVEDYERLSTKASWYDRYARIVVAEEGDLYKTYHTYDCDKWGDSSFWIHNIDWVKNDSQYTKCPYCN